MNERGLSLRKLAYPIEKEDNRILRASEFKAEPHVIEKLEVNFRRDGA